ncbi:MAG: MobF family relaxase [Aurantimonas endophytica]|uniref:MobF family relaxase n=1 Tax=Aurantimonas endophytica TaxID=1522175 RepID=UPI003002868C
MTATFHALGAGRDAGLYYVSDPNREARPRNRDEYYLADGGGVWWSTGSSVVTHAAPIDKESFRDLCAGVHPRSGKGIVRGSGERHRAGWDVTFSAPKSVSLLWAAGSDVQRAAIEELQGKAVEAALSFVERQALLEVRLGAGGTIREAPTDIIVGRFAHTTSRAGDPNIHTHCVLMNVAGSADGVWRTLEPDAMFKWTKTIGAAYRAELSRMLAEQGFALRPAGRDQIEIVGVGEDLIETFSKRSREIEAIVGDRETASGARKQLAALSTRQSKEMLPTDAELEARWHEEFGQAREQLWEQALEAARGRDLARQRTPTDHRGDRNGRDGVDPARGDGPQLDPIPVEGTGPAARGASSLLSHQSVIDRREVLRQSLIEASREGIGIAAVEAELEALQADGSLLMLQDGRSAAWTTEHLMEREAAMLKACNRADEREFFLADALQDALEQTSHLSEEQRAAVFGAASRHGVSLIEAGAGTGKTTLASAIKGAADRSGLKVVGLAPTWLAADELSRSIGVPAQAVAKWRYDRQAQGTAALRGMQELPALDSRTVVLLDEAGMLGTLDMAAVLTAAASAGAKVIAFGDRRQLEAVSQGNPLALIAEELRHVETLTVIRRQHHAWQRSASIAMSEGRFDEAFNAYHDHGAIQFAKDQVTALTETIRHWTELREAHQDDVVIVTRSNRDAGLLNHLARQTLRQAGTLAASDIHVRAIDRRNNAVALALATGDRIRFGANLKALGIRNGTRGTVVAIDSEGDAGDPIVHVELEDGRTVAERWSDYAPPQRGTSVRPLPRITHAYAGTVYSVQGRTAAAAVFHVGSRTDARETYVAMTRHRADVRVVVDCDRLLREASREILDMDAPDTDKLAALVVEAERFDEKLNIASFRQRLADRRTPALDGARGRNDGLSL